MAICSWGGEEEEGRGYERKMRRRGKGGEEEGGRWNGEEGIFRMARSEGERGEHLEGRRRMMRW